MTENHARPKFDLGAALDALVRWLQSVGVKLPNTAAHIMKVIGSLIFSAVDMVAGSLALSWMFTQLTPAEFIPTAKVLAWCLSIALFFVVRSLVDDKDGNWWQGPSLFGWVLNVLDSFIDSSVAFILFGQAHFLLEPGFGSFKTAIAMMPFFGWFVWALIFFISLTSEHWREAMTPQVSAHPATESADEPADQSDVPPPAPSSDAAANSAEWPEERHIKPNIAIQRFEKHADKLHVYIFPKSAPAGSNPNGWCLVTEMPASASYS